MLDYVKKLPWKLGFFLSSCKIFCDCIVEWQHFMLRINLSWQSSLMIWELCMLLKNVCVQCLVSSLELCTFPRTICVMTMLLNLSIRFHFLVPKDCNTFSMLEDLGSLEKSPQKVFPKHIFDTKHYFVCCQCCHPWCSC